ncbi:MAG: hypothetical protein LBM25_01615 [Bacteroidales bacterium]|jgi:hypothetical protein|nr:hypothetical protein [Bacteroidales bacterium]
MKKQLILPIALLFCINNIIYCQNSFNNKRGERNYESYSSKRWDIVSIVMEGGYGFVTTKGNINQQAFFSVSALSRINDYISLGLNFDGSIFYRKDSFIKKHPRIYSIPFSLSLHYNFLSLSYDKFIPILDMKIGYDFMSIESSTLLFIPSIGVKYIINEDLNVLIKANYSFYTPIRDINKIDNVIDYNINRPLQSIFVSIGVEYR